MSTGQKKKRRREQGKKKRKQRRTIPISVSNDALANAVDVIHIPVPLAEACATLNNAMGIVEEEKVNGIQPEPIHTSMVSLTVWSDILAFYREIHCIPKPDDWDKNEQMILDTPEELQTYRTRVEYRDWRLQPAVEYLRKHHTGPGGDINKIVDAADYLDYPLLLNACYQALGHWWTSMSIKDLQKQYRIPDEDKLSAGEQKRLKKLFGWALEPGSKWPTK